MKTQEVTIKPIVNVVLHSDTEVLDEVMVVAYGTTKKSSFTGAAATVKGEKLAKLQSSNLSKSLEGTVAGVQISQSTGQPGAAASIIIRGLGSISASQSPLIVVDGVPYEGSLNSISSQDIETMTVLKDAAANSMYGARGANGVILITTKKGEEGKTKVNFDMRVGINSRGVSAYDVMTQEDIPQYYETMWRSYRNYILLKQNGKYDLEQSNMLASELFLKNTLGYNIYNIPDNEVVGIDGKINPNAGAYKWNENWLDESFQDQLRQEYNFNVSGANGKTSYYASLGYLNDKGYIVNSNFERFSARVKAEQTVGNNFVFGANISYVNTVQNAPDAGGTNYSNLFMFSQQIAPIYPVYLRDLETGDLILDENGEKQYDFGGGVRKYAQDQNPLATNKLGINEYITDNVSLRGYAHYTFLKDFKFSVNAAYDLFNQYSTAYMTPVGGDAASVNGRGEKQSQRIGAFNINELLTWDKEFGVHHINILLGHENKFNNTRLLYGHMTEFVNPQNPEFSNAASYQDLTSSNTEYAIEGYFTRAEYNYNERYYLSGSFRRDGSSVFHPDNRWGSFWSVGGSWRISQENFMSDIEWITDLKLKASYGTQGNDNIGYYKAYTNLYNVDRVSSKPGLTLTFRGNPDLTWEKSNNFNAGFETRLFDRLSINADFFIKETKDMLYASPLPASMGNPNWIYRNEMDMRNIGVEFDLSYDVIKSNDILWNISFNGLHYKNELTRLPSDKDPNGYAAGYYWRKEGGSLYDWYIYEYAGVDQENGLPLYNYYYKDENGIEQCETVNSTSYATLRETGKSALPDFTGGLSTSLQMYGFDFSVQTAFQIGGYVMDSSYQGFMNGGSNGTNFHKDILNHWSETNTTSNIPDVIFDDVEVNGVSDRWLTKASYFSLRNVTLGYTFPKSLLNKTGIGSLRIYGTADNVFLASKRKGLDPRQSFSGTISENYSAIRTMSLGLSLSF